MAIIVQFVVKVPDRDRFVATAKKFEPLFEAEGARNSAIYFNQNDPNEVTTMAEWDHHDVMHAASEKFGEQFNDEAGTGGLDWATYLWEAL